MIPFVVETSGRLGPSAFGLLQRICGTRTYLRSRFISNISMICAISLDKSLKATRELFLRRLGNFSESGDKMFPHRTPILLDLTSIEQKYNLYSKYVFDNQLF